MHQRRYAGRLRLARHNARAGRVHRLEVLGAAFREDAHEIDDRIRPPHGGCNGVWIAQVRLRGVDLPDAAQRLQMTRKMRPTACDPHAPAALGEGAHDITSEKTAAAKNNREPTLGNLRLCHVKQSACADAIK